MRDPIEQIICEALTGARDKNSAIRRSTCNIVARHVMFCGCGAILDQRTIAVLEDDNRTIGALCPDCAIKTDRQIRQQFAGEDLTPFTWKTWDALFAIGELCTALEVKP